MHIGIHCFEYPPCNHGGIGSFSKDLAEGLVRQGYDVTVFGFYFENILDITEPAEETINGVRIIRYPQYLEFSNVRMNIFFSRIKLYRLIKELHKEKPFDVIESPENAGWLPFGTPNSIPLITRLHGGVAYLDSELKRQTSRLSKLLERFQLKKSDKIISVSDYAGKKTLMLHGLEEKGYDVIYNSVNIPKNVQCNNSKIINGLIVFTGSVMPKKGVEELMLALNIVFEKFPNATMKFAGKTIQKKDGNPYTVYLLNLLDEKYRKNVEFLGQINREKDLFPLLCQSQLCCFPSHVETFAMAPLEAMALGKPVVFTEYTSGKETLEHMESGLLCKTKIPTDIAEKIIMLLDDEDLCRRLGSNAKERIEGLFNYDRWLKSNVDFFEKSIL